MENDIQEIACVGCGSLKKELFSHKNGFSIYRCSDCQMLSLYQIPDVSHVYTADYFTGGSKGFGYVNYDSDKEPMRSAFEVALSRIEKHSKQKSNLLDVGAATGFFLKIADSAGWKVSGVEFADYAAEVGRQNGFEIKTGTLSDVPKPNGFFDVVTMFDVIEHLPNPEADLLRANHLLNSGGVIAINTPDSGSFYAKLLGKNWHLIVPPEHIHYFNLESLKLLLKRAGFEVLETSRMGKVFTLEYVLHTLGKWLKIKSLLKFASRLKGGKLGSIRLPVNFRDNIFVIARKI